MNARYEVWPTDDLRPDPANRLMFDPLGDEELKNLADSVRQHGLINAITVAPDGLIIAGEQRWRAAVMAELTSVPVMIVDDPTPRDVELLRIEENIRRRALKPTEMARAIRRLYELRDVTRGGVRDGAGAGAEQDANPESNWDHPSLIPEDGSESEKPQQTSPVSDIAKQAGLTEDTVIRYNTLADLIPALGTLLDLKKLPFRTAYKLAQLPAEQQELIASTFTEEQLRNEQMIKKVKANLEALNDELERLTKELDDSDVERVRKEKGEEIDRLRQEHERVLAKAVEDMERKEAVHQREIAQLTRERNYARKWEERDPLHKAVTGAIALVQKDAVESARFLTRQRSLLGYVGFHVEIAELLVPWLQRYAAELRRESNRPVVSDETEPLNIRMARLKRMQKQLAEQLDDQSDTKEIIGDEAQ